MGIRTLNGTIFETQSLNTHALTAPLVFGFCLPSLECQFLTGQQTDAKKEHEIQDNQKENDKENDRKERDNQEGEKRSEEEGEQEGEEICCVDIETED